MFEYPPSSLLFETTLNFSIIIGPIKSSCKTVAILSEVPKSFSTSFLTSSYEKPPIFESGTS